MLPERWRQIERLYHAAWNQSPSQRANFLAEACGGDEELLREVESLLAQEGSLPTIGLTDRSAWEATANIAALTMQLQAGAQVGPYKLQAPIGAGGMGQVFRAVDTRLRRTVAIKFLLGRDMADPAHRRRFLQEARAASALNHPNIVVIYDISQQDGIDFLTMEHIPGQTLKDLIPAQGMPIDKVAELGSQIASALAAAHAAGIVHRDIKPANIMVTPDQQVKVLDFGLAKMSPLAAAASEGAEQTVLEVTTPGIVMGTVAYMSPEQTRGEPVDGSSDIFSLGCVLYQAVTGRLPFHGPSTLATMHEIATATPPAPGTLRPDLPAAFDRLIAACLEKNPKQRPGSAQVAVDLKRLVSSREEAPARVRTERQSVAVIPFQLRTSIQEDQFLSVALADAVIHRLSSTGKLLVRPIASVMRYKGTETEWAQVARDLNVDTVVEGTIQKMGAKVRVMVQAHRASDTRTLHSAKHDGELDDLFGLQDRIADSVSDVFVPREHSSAHPAAPPTKNPLAFELYLRAVDRLAYWNKFDISSAIEMLSRVVELDPAFADAWGRLAQAYAHIGMHFDPDPRWFEQAERTIAKTLELDPVQCDAHCARGFLLWSPSRGFQNRPALRAINAALKINPNRYNIRQYRSGILFHLGFYTDAERDLEESLLANPGNSFSVVCLGTVAQYRGDYAAAHEFTEQALALDPAQMHAHLFAPLNPLFMGRIEQAREKLRQSSQMIPGEPQLTAIEGLIAAYEGNFQRAEQLADEAAAGNKKSVTHTHHVWHCAAGAYAMCGKPDKSILELRRCAKMGLPNYLLFGRDPCLRSLQDNPDFTALMSDLRREHDQYREEFDFAGETQ
jgi:serine/threonine protein kinase/tetratricopeptide (TPR) repeat protein